MHKNKTCPDWHQTTLWWHQLLAPAQPAHSAHQLVGSGSSCGVFVHAAVDQVHDSLQPGKRAAESAAGDACPAQHNARSRPWWHVRHTHVPRGCSWQAARWPSQPCCAVVPTGCAAAACCAALPTDCAAAACCAAVPIGCADVYQGNAACVPHLGALIRRALPPLSHVQPQPCLLSISEFTGGETAVQKLVSKLNCCAT